MCYSNREKRKLERVIRHQFNKSKVIPRIDEILFDGSEIQGLFRARFIDPIGARVYAALETDFFLFFEPDFNAFAYIVPKRAYEPADIEREEYWAFDVKERREEHLRSIIEEEAEWWKEEMEAAAREETMEEMEAWVASVEQAEIDRANEADLEQFLDELEESRIGYNLPEDIDAGLFTQALQHRRMQEDDASE